MLISMRNPLRLLALVSMVAAAAPHGSAQTPSPFASAAAGSAIHMDVEVTDRNGDPVEGLTAADFTLKQDKEPRPLLDVRAIGSGSVPTEGILLIDDVNAPITVIGNERQQIEKFLRANEGRLPIPLRLAVVTDTGTQLGRAATSDGNALAAQLDQMEIGLREVRRGAGFYGAVERFQISMTALNGLIGQAAKLPGRKVILWVSPGWPALSGPEVMLSNAQEEQIFSQVVGYSNEMRKSDVVLYNINPLGPTESVGAQGYYETFLSPVRRSQDAQYGDLNLQVLAAQSGGLVLSSNDITGMLARCAREASSFYRVSFDALPADRKSTFHVVQVSVTKPGVTARTRNGYYVEP